MMEKQVLTGMLAEDWYGIVQVHAILNCTLPKPLGGKGRGQREERGRGRGRGESKEGVREREGGGTHPETWINS